MINDYEGIFEIHRNGVLLDVVHNQVTDVLLNYLAGLLTGMPPPPLQIKYLAVGSGTSSSTELISLVNETFRTQYTSAPVLDGVGAVRTEFVILAEEAIGEIKEIGIFAGASATTSKDSGILISRIPWVYTKTGSDEFTIIRTDRIRRG